MTPPTLIRARRWFADRSIRTKLAIGFGSLVAITMVLVVTSAGASAGAADRIERATTLRAPGALASARAQAQLLRMVGSIQGYLAFGDRQYRDRFESDQAAFDQALGELTRLADSVALDEDPVAVRDMSRRLAELHSAYDRWRALPPRLFQIRDDQMAREPALRILQERVTPHAIAPILSNLSDMLAIQRRREPSASNLAVLAAMTDYQSSFLSMVSGLRGYVTTTRPGFKFEFGANRTINESAWEALKRQQGTLEPTQQRHLEAIAGARTSFAPLPEQMFDIVEGPHAREDLYLFRTEGVPPTDAMIQVLDTIATTEQRLLQSELGDGRDRLQAALLQTTIGGLLAILLAVLLATLFGSAIARPVRRLTSVAESIEAGDLQVVAHVGSEDEIGRLAATFNRMTERLRETVFALRRTNEVQADYIREVARVTDAAAGVEGGTFEPGSLDEVAMRSDGLGGLARTFQRMAREVRAREEALRAQVRELRIEIDESRQARKVAEITDTDYFKDLRGRAAELRRLVDSGDRPDRNIG